MGQNRAVVFFAGISVACLVFVMLGAGGKVKSPTGTAPDRYVYYPGTEALGSDEIRIIACGSRQGVDGEVLEEAWHHAAAEVPWESLAGQLDRYAEPGFGGSQVVCEPRADGCLGRGKGPPRPVGHGRTSSA